MTPSRALARKTALLPLLVVALPSLIAAGCGGDDESGETATEAAAEATATEEESATETTTKASEQQEQKREQKKAKPKGTRIKLASSQFGQVLFDADDQAIYMFDKEQSSKSECYGQCAVEWPPVLTKGRPVARGEISQRKLGTTKRDDGKRQVTYNGHPLYYYFDEGPTELRCHNVSGFGGLWLALGADGNPV